MSIVEFNESQLLQVLDLLPDRGLVEGIVKASKGINHPQARLDWLRGVLQSLESGDTTKLVQSNDLVHYPVSVREFVEHEYFLDSKGILWPKVLDVLEEMNSGDYQEAILTGAIGCLPAETEFLTPTGWVRMDHYQKGMLVGEYNLETCGLEFREPISYVVKGSIGFHHVKSKYGIDMAVSRGHRVLYRDSSGTLQTASGDELARSIQENKNGFCGKILTTFLPPEREGLSLSDEEIRVQVAVQADGSFDHRREHLRTCKVSLKKKRKIDRLKGLLVEAGIPFSEYPEATRVGFVKFRFQAPIRSKDYSWAWEATPEQLKVITEEVLHWDGSLSNKNYATTSKQSSDFIQYAFSATGRRSAINCTTNESILCKGTPKMLYIVGSTSRIEPSLQSKSKGQLSWVESSDGKMYCFETKTKYFLARHNGKVFVTGNTAKSTLAIYSTAYQLYLLSCYRNPHSLFSLDPASEILFIIQSINEKLAKDVDYSRTKTMLQKSPYFKEKFPFDQSILSEMRFPNRIILRPISGLDTAAIGQNVIGGIIDELNFMALIENSKASTDGGTYDQAISVYNSIARRRKSRFMTKGKLPGLLCLVSSKRYPGQFTDTKIEEHHREVELYGKSTIYVYDKRTWDIKDPSTFSGNWFKVFVGDGGRKPRILEVDEQFPESDSELVMDIPEEYRTEFEKDMMNALRDIAGVATLATHPFILERDKIPLAMRHDRNIFGRDRVDFVETRVEIHKNQFRAPQLPRFVHVDLAVSKDSAGFAVGTVTGFKQVSTGESVELLPDIWIDGTLEIKAPKNGEIQFFKIREVISTLRKLGLAIRWVTFDAFQCISGDTLIWTDNGLVQANQVEAGMVVQSRIGPRSVTKKWSFGVQKTIRMTTTDHSILEMTHNHKIEVAVGWHWPTINGSQYKRPIWGWVEAKNLKVGDVINARAEPSEVLVCSLQALPTIDRGGVRENRYHVPRHLTIEFAQLLGIIWGDGDFTQDGVRVTCAMGEEQYVQRAFDAVSWDARITGKSLNACTVSFSSRGVVSWMRKCGLVKTDDIPELIKRSPAPVQAAFIRGLFSTDGSVSKRDGECNFSTRHWKWAEYVHVFMRSAYGISSCIVSSKRTGDHYPTDSEVQYIVVVRGSRQQFHDAIGFCYGSKAEILEQHLNRPGRELWVRVESLEESSSEVFDFEVEEDHSYVANGLISHNSIDSIQLLKQAGFIVGRQSMDSTTHPYDFTKNALYEGRLSIPYHEKLVNELASLEKDVKRNKVDHPPRGCICKDSLVQCADNVVLTIGQLVEDYERGVIHLGVSWDIEKSVSVSIPLEHPRITKYVTELIEVELENGLVIRCTPDHPFLLESNQYVAAEELQSGDSLRS